MALYSAVAAVACAPDVNRVNLTVPPGAATGLSCVDDAGVGLLARLTNAAMDTATFSVVVDYLDLDGVTSARPRGLVEHCADPGCPVLRRDCARVTLTGVIGQSDVDLQNRALDALAGSPITVDAPDGVVVVRAVVTGEECATVMPTSGGAPAFAPNLLAGCIYSAPLQLDLVSGEIELELDVLATGCTDDAVCICANLEHADVFAWCGIMPST